MRQVLVIDDKRNILHVISAVLKREGYGVTIATTGEEAISKLKKNEIDVVITDYLLPGMDGLKVLELVKEKDPSIPVILITAYGSIEMAVEAMKLGAYNYLTKPVNYDEMLVLIKEATEKKRLVEENASLNKKLQNTYSFQNIIGQSDKMQEIFDTIQKVANSKANILITGESGTGKELIAQAIHYSSDRSSRPFIAINCAAIPETLLENELFGHEKGSYTGAHKTEKGKFELADTGTIFLDEIGDISQNMQLKLLRILQERELTKIGGSESIAVDIRVIASTNKNLDQEVEKGNFREDLFYRLNVVTINIPPLRERKESIPFLAEHFLQKYCDENSKDINGFEQRVIDSFMSYDWPGNVRELENTIERAVVMCTFNKITLANIRKGIAKNIDSTELAKDLNIPPEGLDLRKLEKEIITKALEKSKWNQTKASELLKITRKQLRTKMKKYSLLS
jgi:DNA-binding NtrC family response regulator